MQTQTQTKIRPIIKRIGSKNRIAPWIITRLQKAQWSTYVEPFCGSGAVYFRMVNDGVFDAIKKRGKHPRIVLNDTDKRIFNIFKTCRDFPQELAYLVSMTPYSRLEYDQAKEYLQEVEGFDDIEKARASLLQQWQSFNSVGRSWGITRRNVPDMSLGTPEGWKRLPDSLIAASKHLQLEDARKSLLHNHASVSGIAINSDKGTGSFSVTRHSEKNTPDAQKNWQRLPNKLLQASQHLQASLAPLKSVNLENDDAVTCMERWQGENTAFYIDPPYVDFEGLYGQRDNEDLHHRLAQAANNITAACVAISYYPHEILNDLYPHERWERHYKRTVASAKVIGIDSKNKTRSERTEMLLVRRDFTPRLGSQKGLFN